jgi:NusA N-terminal domain.
MLRWPTWSPARRASSARKCSRRWSRPSRRPGRAKYGLEHDIRAEIDRKTGEIKLLRYMQVADPVENENTQVPLVEAQRRNPEARSATS